MTFEAAKGIIRLDVVSPDGGVHVEQLSFRPRALVVWWSLETDPVTALGNCGGMGIAAEGSGQAALAWAADDRLAAGVLGRWSSDSAFLGCSDPGGASRVRGVIRTVEHGFVLEYNGRSDGVWDVHYLALGGTDLRSAAVRSVQLERAGEHSVGGLGFKPDFLLFLPGAGAPAFPFEAGLAPGIGVTTEPAQQAAAGFGARVDRTDTLARGALRGDAVVALPEPDDSGAYAFLAHVVSLDPDGFTLATTREPARPLPLACLALAGGQYAAGVAAAAQRRPRRAKQKVGFEPAGLLLFSSGLDAVPRVRDIGRLCVGGVSANGGGCVSWSVRSRRAWPLEPRARSSTESVLEVVDTTSGDLHARAVLEAITPDGFRLEWPLADRHQRDYGYVAFGSEVRPGTPRRPRLWFLWPARRLRRLLRQ
jgi:hypothetical protein